jgi:hypothetical protein
MSILRYTDIDHIRDALAQLAASRQADADFLPAAQSFTDRDAGKLTVLLEELAFLRQQAGSGGDGQHPDLARTHRFRAEGRSATSAEKALARALSSAAHFFSDHHDVVLTLAEMTRLPDGIYRAVVEVHITIFEKSTDARKDDIRIEDQHQVDHARNDDRKRDAKRTTQMIFDHFMHVKSAAPGNLPASFLVNITDAGLLNKMIEKQFFKSSQPDQSLLPPPGQPFTMLVRTSDPSEEERPKPR